MRNLVTGAYVVLCLLEAAGLHHAAHLLLLFAAQRTRHRLPQRSELVLLRRHRPHA